MSIYQDNFLNRKFGIFNHFLYNQPSTTPPDGLTWDEEIARWKHQCDAFDPEKIAYDLHRIGAGYYFITIMQGTRFLLAPNSTFDHIAGTKPGEACSERDIIAELIPALKKYDIDLGLYFTGDGPYNDEKCGKAFSFTKERGQVPDEFVNKWAAVLEEYAVRYGDAVKYWWIDGCYDSNSGAKLGYRPELVEMYYTAVKKGNPNVLATFNNGIKPELYKYFEKEEFTSGEQTFFTHVPEHRFVKNAQAHLLIPLGTNPGGWNKWCMRGLSITRERLKNYISYVNEAGGVVTLDIFIDKEGNWDEEQLDALIGLMD